MDGDLDLLRTIKFGGPWRLNRSRGDGTFIIQFGDSGLGFGTSAVDWDNDGDIDLTAGGYFWRNLLVETGNLSFVRIGCVDDSECGTQYFSLPAWADVDMDGDLDCARAGFADGKELAKFYRNQTYSGDCRTCEALKRYVTIRPVREAPPNGPRGWRDYTEDQFGARVELLIRNDPNTVAAGLRRVQFTTSASGYLNQNQYPLHFGLPLDPAPEDPNEDLRFDVYVDFPARAGEPDHGPWRVDWTVNSQLANINLADIYADCNDPETLGRPITVYREGRVRFRGADPNETPSDPNIARLYTLGGAIRLPDPNVPGIPVLTTGNVFAGLRFITEPNFPEMRVREFIIDGQLDQTTSGCAYNLVVLDVTDPNSKVIMGGLKAKTFADNFRTFIHVPPPDPNEPDFVLPRNNNSTTRTYEVRARLTSHDLRPRPDPNGLLSDFHVRVDKGLNTVNVLSAMGTLCTQNMTLRGDTNTPVTIRLSLTGN